MSLARCQTCKKLYQKTRKTICPACEELEQGHYEAVRTYLSEHPDQVAEQVSEATGVPLETVFRFIEEGRIEAQGKGPKALCGHCGEPAINSTKRLCQSCLEKLNAKLIREQSRITLPDKKEIDLKRASSSFRVGMNVADSLASRLDR
jgi:hypothetical protein